MASTGLNVKRFRRASFGWFWDQLRVGFWFTPLVMSFISILLSRIVMRVDTHIPNYILLSGRTILSEDSAQLRSILVGMSTTTLATAGVVFSLLTLPLSTVASQYGSRLLRIYLGDRTTQFVLGMFTGTFCFCLVTAIYLPPQGQLDEVPQLTVTFALLLFLTTFASLIVLIQHFSTALQAPKIVAAAGAELRSTVEELAGEWVEDFDRSQLREDNISNDFPVEGGFVIRTKDTGYIQSVNLGQMLYLALNEDLFVRIVRKPGQFVSTGDQVALVWPAKSVNLRRAIKLRRAFKVGRQRTPTLDIEYAVDQLAEVALRAMSPAINDPLTAMSCLDYLGTGLALFVERVSLRPSFIGSEGRIRLIYEPVSFNELLAAAFDMLRHASCNNAAVLVRMLDTIEVISRKTQQSEHRNVLRSHVEKVLAESQAGDLIDADRLVIFLRSEELTNILS